MDGDGSVRTVRYAGIFGVDTFLAMVQHPWVQKLPLGIGTPGTAQGAAAEEDQRAAAGSVMYGVTLNVED
ncbi:MAG: hypothetical protein WCI88_10525 [Chloroflexota bacterium]